MNLNVLVVSTDPAHSLGDALDEDLRRGRGKPVAMTDPLTGGRLKATEVDTNEALEQFRESLAAFDVGKLAEALGVSGELLESIGLQEFSGLLKDPPPGLDELVALGNVMDERSSEFDVIVVDTAPTGHTLRLLALPQFLDGLLGKLIKLRVQLSGLTSTLKSLLGDGGAKERAETLDKAMENLEQFKMKMVRMQERLKDHETTNFLVVTVPTMLAVKESQRLVSELKLKGIEVPAIVVNQCVGTENDNSREAILQYYNRRKDGQQRWIQELKRILDDVSRSHEFRSNGDPSPIALSTLSFFDVELVGIPALGYVGSKHFATNPNFQHLKVKKEDRADPKVIICGGKGGVGKTTTSSSLGVSLAVEGLNVAIVSTDPAHSLGDAVDLDLSGRDMVECSLAGVPGFVGEGSLSVMEIDPSSALSDFKSVVNQALGKGEFDTPGFRSALQDIENVFDTLPAGTDEVVALAKVISLIRNGAYDCVILDTAPTGHTLRMLSTPGFIADLIDRLVTISDKINANPAVKMLVAGAAGSDAADLKNVATKAKSQLLSFQMQMYDLEDLFANSESTEFLIVTVATELAVRESARLLNELTFAEAEMQLKVRNVIVNQVLKDDGSDTRAFFSHVSRTQSNAIQALESYLASIPCSERSVTKIQLLDTEPRGVFGLKAVANELIKETQHAQ